jgi:hypothetical protein
MQASEKEVCLILALKELQANHPLARWGFFVIALLRSMTVLWTLIRTLRHIFLPV